MIDNMKLLGNHSKYSFQKEAKSITLIEACLNEYPLLMHWHAPTIKLL